MSQTSRISLLAGAAVIGLGSTALAENGQAWSNADEVRALVSEMMADAETRSSLLQSGGTAGHDGKHFFLSSGDGSFRLDISGQIQFRYYMNFRNDSDADNDGFAEDDFESGFQTRRTKLFFEGNVFDPNLYFRLNGNFYDDRAGPAGDSTGNFRLEDAYVGYRWDNGFSLQWGQFKLPFLREELVSEAYQLAADTSLTNRVFTLGRSQGVQLAYSAEDFRVMAAFSDGGNAANSEFGSARGVTGTGFLAGGESDWSVTARAEIKFMGSWDQFQDFTSLPGSEMGIMLGIAGHYEGGDRTSSLFSTGHYNYGAWTADISIEGDGWNLYVAGVGGYSDYNNVNAGLLGNVVPADVDFSDYGLIAQGGIFIPDTDWEFFARYDVIFADKDRFANREDETFNTLTFGVNYYMYGHASKFTFDVQWFIDGAGQNVLGGFAQPSIGYLTDDDENEVVLRFQWQLLF